MSIFCVIYVNRVIATITTCIIVGTSIADWFIITICVVIICRYCFLFATICIGIVIDSSLVLLIVLIQEALSISLSVSIQVSSPHILSNIASSDNISPVSGLTWNQNLPFSRKTMSLDESLSFLPIQLTLVSIHFQSSTSSSTLILSLEVLAQYKL